MRLAVVLFNLGGPDGPKAVRPFLANLFSDPAIIGLPAIVRLPLAQLIAARRAKTAQANYDKMGGASPLLAETRAQAAALQARLSGDGVEAEVFIAMRYWKPFAQETAAAVAAFAPDEIVLLPLYPQYSTTTTASSLEEWAKAYKGPGRARAICCYPTAGGLARANAEAIAETWAAAGSPAAVRLLFSAHGLPQKVVDGGDPYRAQIEATAAATAALLPQFADWRVCFQSRVGPMKWLTPDTESEIRGAAQDGKGVLICPIAFVSEHVETLVELDIDYAHAAEAAGCAPYLRSPTASVREAFITDLAAAALGALGRASGAAPYGDWRCPKTLGKCGMRAAA
ncbi:ferrochelatase [Phenylobacterium immobile]|uniref:ferrochelatase n=1 Tax=Phenylobacterium immobile TaxID=21 RepID=UPI000A5B90AE|nr:ferrochelatase [Phenylobacterium immobile]